jgi:hypothetical protein
MKDFKKQQESQVNHQIWAGHKPGKSSDFAMDQDLKKAAKKPGKSSDLPVDQDLKEQQASNVNHHIPNGSGSQEASREQGKSSYLAVDQDLKRQQESQVNQLISPWIRIKK